MIYEYRRYDVMPGRLTDLTNRFERHTLRIWRRCGIEVVGFWTADVGESNVLHYLLSWKNIEHRERLWDRFVADEEWIRVKEASEAAGQLVRRVHNELWAPTSFSPLH